MCVGKRHFLSDKQIYQRANPRKVGFCHALFLHFARHISHRLREIFANTPAHTGCLESIASRAMILQLSEGTGLTGAPRAAISPATSGLLGQCSVTQSPSCRPPELPY